MTVIPEMKPSVAEASNSDTISSSINCCSNTDSSSISMDEEAAEMINRKSICTNADFDISDTMIQRSKTVDIEFENVKYEVRQFSFSERKFITKEILHGINGAFRSGEITAIMGPSGSGKSTLLNVMTGFRATGVTGCIKVNGEVVSTSSESFRKLSCYIHQDDLLRPQLTVGETMLLATHLKLGYKVSKQKKWSLIKNILTQLGLEHRINVFTLKLSGGQKKRLAVALELISNPPVLFLDEPTSGLDSSSCTQCIGLLKKLAAQGHTIVCTIHQPSALLFEMFDKIYTVVEGNCMYQGSVRDLVPFLNDQGLICPSYHNPADFLLEVAVGEHKRNLEKLINAANKKYYEDIDLNELNRYTKLVERIKENIARKSLGNTEAALNRKPATLAQIPNCDYVKSNVETSKLMQAKDDLILSNYYANYSNKKLQSSTFLQQYLLLFQRILICSRRHYFLLMARLLSHVGIAILFGYLYHNVGINATTVLGNYVYFYGSILLLVYTGKMAVVLTFPLEIDMLTREHFNRWYNLGPYFLSLLSFEVPFQSVCAALYVVISSYLTGNSSSDSFRLYFFVVLAVVTSLTAQSWGFFVGATLPIKLAVFIGPILAVLFSVFGFCMRYIDTTPLLRWMWHISYFRAGFHGALNVIYGMDRPFMPCPKDIIYCHFRSPKVFLDYMMIGDMSIWDSLILMGGIIGVMHVLTVLILWHKLNKR